MRNIPFVPNTPDNLHCTPASFMMIAKYFDSSFNIQMDEWATICGFEVGKGTWANGGLLWFVEHGYDVLHYEDFDNEVFIKEQGNYLLALHGKETGEWMIHHTNIEAEVKRTKAILAHKNIFKQTIPSLADMRYLLDEGYLLRISVNWKKLHGKQGYEGHSIVGFSYDDKHMFVHDPGLPQQKNLALPWEFIDAISADPTLQNREVDAIRMSENYNNSSQNVDGTIGA